MKHKKGVPIHVLIIDDDPDSVEILKSKLNELTYAFEMEVFESGLTALRILRERPKTFLPDIIFLDIYIVNEDGLEILSLLKAEKAFEKIPIIIRSVSKEHADIVQTYKRGGVLFLSKIGEFQVLDGMIKQLISSGIIQPKG